MCTDLRSRVVKCTLKASKTRTDSSHSPTGAMSNASASSHSSKSRRSKLGGHSLSSGTLGSHEFVANALRSYPTRFDFDYFDDGLVRHECLRGQLWQHYITYMADAATFQLVRRGCQCTQSIPILSLFRSKCFQPLLQLVFIYL